MDRIVMEHRVSITIDTQRWYLIADPRMDARTVVVQDPEAFARALVGSRPPAPLVAAPAALVATPPAPVVPALPYELMDRRDGGRMPVYAKLGATREHLAAAIWKKQHKLSPRQREIAFCIIGINTTPVTGKELAILRGDRGPSLVYNAMRQAVNIAGITPRTYENISKGLLARHELSRTQDGTT